MRRLVIIIAGLVLSACGSMYQTSYRYMPPSTEEGQLCVAQCQQSRRSCQRITGNTNERCEVKARKQAELEYRAYVEMQHLDGRAVQKSINDFYRPHGCEDANPQCSLDYRACYELCGGQVLQNESSYRSF